MSTTIDQRVVEMRFDNKQFEKNVQTSLSTLEKLKSSLKLDKAAEGLTNIKKAAINLNFNGLGAGIDAVQAKFTALQAVGIAALTNITNSAVNAGKRMVSALTIDPVKTGFSEYETKIGAIQTIMSNTASKGTTMEDVTRVIGELNTYADKTIYNFAEMTKNIGTFTAAGVGLEESATAIQGIANLAAASGSTSQQASTAMYQLSQALAAGTVKLMDWNSVVNAGMGGEKFQEALKETARRHGIAVDDMIAKNGSFRESLQEGWITADVLNETLNNFTVKGATEYSKAMMEAGEWTKEQADAFVEEAQAMEEAATKVKTFTQLWDTLKESAQSGWSQTWELILGDFEEAKEFFSELSDIFGTAINNMSDARNNVLTGALSNSVLADDWDALVKAGDATEDFQNALKETAKAHGIAIDQMIEAEGSFRETLKSGWLSSDILTETLNSANIDVSGLTSDIENLSDAELQAIGYTEEQRIALKNLADSAKKAGTPLNELVDKMSRPTGRELLLESLMNAIKGVQKVFGEVSKAYEEIFPPATSDQLYSVIKGINEFSKCLIISGDNADKLYRSCKGLFAILDIITTLTGGGLKVALKLICKLLGMADVDILSLTASAGDAAVAFRDWLFENNRLAQGFDKLSSGLESGVKTLGEWLNKVKSIPEVQSAIAHLDAIFANTLNDINDYFSGGIDRIREFVERVKAMDDLTLDDIDGIFEDFKENVLKYFTDIDGKFDDAEKAIEDFKNEIKENFKDVSGQFDGVKGKVLEFVEFIKSKFSNIGLGEIFTIGVSASLIAFVTQISKALKLIKDPVKAFTGVMDSFSGVLNAFAFQIKSKAVIDIAIAIAILAGSLTLIALIPSEKLIESTIALAVLSACLLSLAAAFSMLEKFKLIDDIGKIALSITGLAASLLILVYAMKGIETINKDAILENMTVLMLLSTALVMVSVVLSKAAPTLSSGSLFLISFASSIYLLVQALISVNNLNLQNIRQSLEVILAVITAISLVALASQKATIGSAASILSVAVSLLLFVEVIDKLTNMEPSKILSNIETFIVVFGSFALLMVASSQAGRYAAKGGVAVLAMSAALLLIIEAFEKIASLDKSELKKALSSISMILLVFGAVVALSNFAGANAAKAGVMILLMSGALLALSVVMTILSSLDPAGLMRAVGAITALQLCFAVLIGVTKLAEDCKATLIILAATIGILGVALGALSMIDSKSLLSASASLSAVIAMFALLVASTKFAQTATLTLVVLTAVVGALSFMLYKLADLPVENTLGVAASLSILLLSLSGTLVILSAIGTAAVPALIGIGLLSALILALAVVAGAITIGFGAVATGLGVLMSKIPELEDFLNVGLPILEKIAYGIGSFFGNIIGGFSSGVTSGLPEIGTHLSDFITNAGPFLSSIKNVDASGVEAAKMLAELILILTAADILNAITSFAGGKSSFASFGSELTEFGKCLRTYSTTITGVNPEVISRSVEASKGLVDLANNLPNSGGVAGFFAGENDWNTFSTGLVGFGMTLKSYGDAVEGVKTGAITNSVEAAKGLVDISNSLPNGGSSVLEFFIGDNDWNTFSTGLVGFGMTLKSYGDAVEGVKTDAISNSVAAAEELVSLATILPNSGGLLSKIVGDNGFNQFADGLSEFGENLKEYSSSVSGVDVDSISNSVEATKSLTNLADETSDKGGVLDGIVTFGKNLVTFGVSFVACYASLKAIDTAKLSNVINGVSELVRMTKSLSGADTSSMTNFTKSLATLGQNGVDGFIKAFTDATPKARAAITMMLNASVLVARGNYKGFYDVGAYLVSGFAKGITDNTYKATARAKAMAKSAEDATKRELDVNSPSRVFFGIGEYVVQGFANGIRDNINLSNNQAESMANSAIDTTNEVLEINSPSKKFKKIGTYVVQGFCDGIVENKKLISSVMTNSFGKTINKSVTAFVNSFNEAMKALGSTGNAKAAKKAIGDLGNELYKESDAYKKSSQNIKDYNKTLKALKKEKKKLDKELKTSKNTDEVKAKLKDVKAAIKETNKAIKDEQKQMVKDSMEVFNQWRDSLKDSAYKAMDIMSATMDSQVDLFKAFEVDSEITKDSVLANMESQIKGVTEWKENLDKLATKGIAEGLLQKLREMGPESAGYVNAFVSMTSEELKKANELYSQEAKMTSSSLLESMRANVQSVKNWAANISALAAKGLNKDILKQLQDMGPESAQYVDAFMNMTASELGEVNALYADTLALDDKIADQLIASYAYAGTDSAKGFSEGLQKQSPDAIAKAEQMATAALNAAKKVLGIHSPSTEFAKVAKFAVQGLVNGFKTYGSLVDQATENIGENSLSSLSKAISGVNDILDSEDLNEPIIRPVLDLSNVESGAKIIDAKFSKTQAMKVSASMNKSFGSLSVKDNVTQPVNNYQFTQNNYSPKALSRTDIYRQTKNQFAAMKGLG